MTTLPARPAQQEQVAPLRQAVLRASTHVSTDETGRPVGIEGPDPTSVLIAFCESGPSEIKLEPIEITSTVPAFREARLGLFRSYAELAALHAIRIRKDGRTNRWVAGDGRSPIRVIPAPELPSDAQRIRVENR